MGQPLILTFDCGTQSLRCTLIDKKGNILGIENFRCKPYLSVKRGYIEQYAQVYQEGLCEVAQKLKKNYGHLWKDIVAVTSTSVRDTCVCMDKDGNAVRPVISWMDQREAKFDMKKNLPWYQRFLFKLVGMSETARFASSMSISASLHSPGTPQRVSCTRKFACMGEKYSAPRLFPFMPAASRRRPADCPSGFWNTQPAALGNRSGIWILSARES